jgi:formylmethanofuran:tetrahydromethanopterin formyltransferase
MTFRRSLITVAFSATAFGLANAFLPASQRHPNVCRTTSTTSAAPPPSSSSSSSVILHAADSNVERIEYKIYPDGRVEQKVIGVKGSDCVKLTEELNQALGEVISSQPTEEMFEQKVELDQTLTNTQSTNGGGGGDSWEGASSW